MQQVVTVREILHGTLDAKQVRVRGWLQNRRTGGGIIFLLLRDGSGVVQCTVRKGKVDEKTFEEFQSTRIESSVELHGEVKADPRAPGGREIQVDEGRVVHPALEEFPIAKQFHGPEFLLDQRHLFVRSDKMRSILRVRAVVLSAVRDWFDKHDFTEVHVPSLTSAAVEGGATLFERKTEDLEKVKSPFERITYDQAFKMIGEEKSGIKWGDDLGYEQEKLLTAKFDRPFFVTHYPKKAKAFYHMPDLKNPEVTLSVDCLAPEGYGEITGGGQRIEDYDALLARIREEGLDPKSYEWYLDLRKFGSVTHSGFGLGLERVVSWVCKLDHIRDAIAFPRLINRIYP